MTEPFLTLDQLHQKYDSLSAGEIILDVRRPEEFQAARIPSARNIPLDQLDQHIEELKQYKTIYLHCKRGGRAKTAWENLQQAGLKNLICISDAGMDQWLERGYPVLRD